MAKPLTADRALELGLFGFAGWAAARRDAEALAIWAFLEATEDDEELKAA